MVDSTALALKNTVPDKVTVPSRTGRTVRTNPTRATLTLSPAGFQVLGNDKKVIATVFPDDIVKVAIGDLPGVDRNAINWRLNTKEDQEKEWDAVRLGYVEQAKKAGLQDRAKRFLEFKRISMMNKLLDDTDAEKGWDADKGWQGKVDACVAEWTQFLARERIPNPGGSSGQRFGPVRGSRSSAASTTTRPAPEGRAGQKNENMPPDAKVEAGLQEIDLWIRAKEYSTAATLAADLLKTAAGTKKDRLVIYELAAKAGSDNKRPAGIDAIKAEMNKTKDPAVHATGFSMMGELYLAEGKSRDAMWMFLWVETVMNQDRDEAFKALARLTQMFESQMDEDQVKKYHEKIKRFLRFHVLKAEDEEENGRKKAQKKTEDSR